MKSPSSSDPRARTHKPMSPRLEAGIAALRAALIEGEESGASTPFDFDAFIARKRKQKRKGP